MGRRQGARDSDVILKEKYLALCESGIIISLWDEGGEVPLLRLFYKDE